MKANELSIGDWVYDAILKENTIIKVLTETKIQGDIDDELWGISTYDPIPLTPEILEKNGFEYNELPFVQGWEQFGLTLYQGGNGYRINCGQNVALRLVSVHELQHALRLCGIEKEIVL